MKQYRIADQVLALNWDDYYIHNNMRIFECNTDEPTDLTYELYQGATTSLPELGPVIQSDYFDIYSITNGYQLIYHNSGNITACIYNEKLQLVTIFTSKQLDETSSKESVIISKDCILNMIDFIFFSIRDTFLIWIQRRGIIAVHSSSLIYNNKAYLFSAPSGTGKTTHTDMWVERYGVEILDGDITAVCIKDKTPIAYGLPWCGTSQRYLNRKIELGGIVFLRQGSQNQVDCLTLFESILSITTRCFTPTWTKELYDLNLAVAENLASNVPCCLLSCLPNQEAVDTIKSFIDSKQ